MLAGSTTLVPLCWPLTIRLTIRATQAEKAQPLVSRMARPEIDNLFHAKAQSEDAKAQFF